MKEHTHSYIILKIMKIQYILMILNLLTVFIILIGIIFLIVGIAGDELQDIIDKEDYYIIQDNDEYGFLNLKLKNNSKTIIGEFHSNNDDEIINHLEINT